MKINIRWQIIFGLGLIIFAGLLHYGHYLIFQDVHHLLSFLGKKIAFVPLEVLFVTLIIHQILSIHERSVIKSKMNMLVGAFYSEVGNDLLSLLNKTAVMDESKRSGFHVRRGWTDKDFIRAAKDAIGLKPSFQVDPDILEEIKNLLGKKRRYLLLLLENPNLMEKESFTDMLWATFHLADELSRRKDFQSLPQSDINHLKNDIRRVYLRLLSQRFSYLKHLKKDYPYLFSLEIRINPFDPHSEIVVTE